MYILFDDIKKNIIFNYIGKFYISKKKDFEIFFIKTIQNIINIYNIKYFPKKIIVNFESKIYYDSKNCSYGGTWNNVREKNYVPTLLLQSWNLQKEDYKNFLDMMVVHEIFHLFVPSIENNGCFSEGFVEFLTYKYNNNLDDIIKNKEIYNKLDNNEYKIHKYPYHYGPFCIYKIYLKNQPKIDDLINNMIFNFNKNYKNYYKIYKKEDIISYDKVLRKLNGSPVIFKKLFSKKCNHTIHKLKE
jgi:hypothetical protein